MFRKPIITLLVVLLATTGAAPVTADPGHNATHTPTGPVETGSEPAVTPTPTETPTPTPAAGTVPFAGDPTLTITDWSYNRGTFRIMLSADVETMLTVTAMPESSSSSGGGVVKRVRLTEGRNVVTIAASSGTVFMTTPNSIRNQRYTYLDASGPPLIGGPFGAGDVRNGILYALLTGAFVLVVLAVRTKLGLDDEAGWVA
jgi:hypothetical protein